MYRHLKDAVLDLDDLLIRTLAGFSIETTSDGYRVVFRFAFYGPNLEDLEETLSGEVRAATVSQYPDIDVMLTGDAVLPEQIDQLQECGILGELHAVQLPPRVKGNPTDAPRWVVRTHAGSQAERIVWRQSIG